METDKKSKYLLGATKHDAWKFIGIILWAFFILCIVGFAFLSVRKPRAENVATNVPHTPKSLEECRQMVATSVAGYQSSQKNYTVAFSNKTKKCLVVEGSTGSDTSESYRLSDIVADKGYLRWKGVGCSTILKSLLTSQGNSQCQLDSVEVWDKIDNRLLRSFSLYHGPHIDIANRDVVPDPGNERRIELLKMNVSAFLGGDNDPGQWEFSLSSVQVAPKDKSSVRSATSTPVAGDRYSLIVPNIDGVSYHEKVEYTEMTDVSHGPYAGYHRILVTALNDDGPPYNDDYVVFATKDYKKFIVDKTFLPALLSGYELNSKNVYGVADLTYDFPPTTIQIGDFVFAGGRIELQPQVSSELLGKFAGYAFYASAEGDSDVYIKADNGLYFSYGLAFAGDPATSRVDRYNLPSRLIYHLKSNKIVAKEKVFEEYGPGGCGSSSNWVRTNIPPSDLKKIGELNTGGGVYAFKDISRPEYLALYKLRAEYHFQHMTYNSADSSTSTEQYSEYVANNPIIFVEDPWHRLIEMKEAKYSSSDGCGKPVIYLYPRQPTEVTVAFENPIKFSVAIPEYKEFWKVLAQPNGILTDLKPNDTDCGAIDYLHKGSEYAKDACKANSYPYLYWAGRTEELYPKLDSGWVVKSADLKDELYSKMTFIGLSKKETDDMLEYWIPEMQSKHAPYYRFTIFQTKDMDSFIPMKVTPAPDTWIRVFLDWSPLYAIPSTLPAPEILHHIDRKGFTLVEWGGLKK